ncbi:MAG: hypothetical protein IPI77_17225 [Saprospiraceae bacterium]|nr:hypothetical protein [Saprospiraceae bacterium]
MRRIIAPPDGSLSKIRVNSFGVGAKENNGAAVTPGDDIPGDTSVGPMNYKGTGIIRRIFAYH